MDDDYPKCAQNEYRNYELKKCEISGQKCVFTHYCTECNIPLIQAIRGSYPG